MNCWGIGMVICGRDSPSKNSNEESPQRWVPAEAVVSVVGKSPETGCVATMLQLSFSLRERDVGKGVSILQHQPRGENKPHRCTGTFEQPSVLDSLVSLSVMSS